MIKHKKSDPFLLTILKSMYREDKLPKMYDIIQFPGSFHTGIILKLEEYTNGFQEVYIIVTIYYFKESKYKLINKINLWQLKFLISAKKIISKLISTTQNVSALIAKIWNTINLTKK